MTGRQIAGVVCCVLAVGFAAWRFVGDYQEAIPLTHSSGLGVSAAVGTFLPPFVLLIIGVALLRKKEPPQE